MSKKLDEIKKGESFSTELDNGTILKVSKMYGGAYVLGAQGEGGLFNRTLFSSRASLEPAMRAAQPDMRKWVAC